MRSVIAVAIIFCIGLFVSWKRKDTFPVTFMYVNEYHTLLSSKDSLNTVQLLNNMRMEDAVYLSFDSVKFTINEDSTFVQTFYESGKFQWEEDTVGYGYTFYHPKRNDTLIKQNFGSWRLSNDTLIVYYTHSYLPDSISFSDIDKYLLKRNKLYYLSCFSYWSHIEKQPFRRRETRQLNIHNSKKVESCSRWLEYKRCE